MYQRPVIRVAIIEDESQIRGGLAALIGGSEGYRCTHSFGSMEDALTEIGSELPDVALIDIGLPGMSGIEGVREATLSESSACDARRLQRRFTHFRSSMCGGARLSVEEHAAGEAASLESLREVVDGGSAYVARGGAPGDRAV
jgi:DNA-binding NarL/FixJ family response regulator